MKKQWKRLLIAALSSSSVFAATWYWYQASDQKFSRNENEKPLAYVGTVVDDIQRRPASRLLWQLVNSGEPLYDGEAIRTSEKGEVRIQFTDSERYLDLEPESLIVIKKSAGEISLDLMEGSLFVNAKNEDANAPGLVLNSENGKVDLSKASASLTKGTGGKVDIDVMEGRASVQGANGQTQDLKSRDEIKIISPTPQKPIAMNAESIQPVTFQWEGFPAQTKVSLWTGPSRKKMQEFKTNENAQSYLKAPLTFGRHYWKLVGTTPQGQKLETRVYRSDVLARYAPTVVFPTADAHISVDALPTAIEFRWQKGEDTRQTTLEIWSDPQLQKKISAKSFTSEDSFSAANLVAGTYYWRMSSLYTDSATPLLGKIQKFTVSTDKTPSSAAIPLVPVQVEMNPQQTQYYIGQPQLDLTWQVDKADQVASWRIKLLEENAPSETAQSFESAKTQITAVVKKPGRYIASVEALNKTGEVLGSEISPPLNILPRPLLGAPSFLPREGSLRAEMNGKTQLQWTALDGAQEYWLTIKKDGKELKKSRYRGPATSLKNLLPGEYEVEVSATDAFGRPGARSIPRKLIVPDNSGLKAPTLKKIQVN